MFDLSSNISAYGTPDLIAVVLLGVIGGVLGSLYNFLIDKTLRKYSIINGYAPSTTFLLTLSFIVVWLLIELMFPCNCFVSL